MALDASAPDGGVLSGPKHELPADAGVDARAPVARAGGAAPVSKAGPAQRAAPSDLFVGSYKGTATITSVIEKKTDHKDIENVSLSIERVSDAEIKFVLPVCQAHATVTGATATLRAGERCDSQNGDVVVRSGTASLDADRLRIDVTVEVRITLLPVSRGSRELQVSFRGTRR